MYKSRQFIKKQLAVIEDLFSAELDEAEVLKKHGVKPSLYRKWLTDEQFLEHFEQRPLKPTIPAACSWPVALSMPPRD